ncbi:MAG: hypothetical protein U1F76_15005 [Candidatus Competibacteraceae bacterium]
MRLISKLSNPAVSRGLITFLISVATIALAFFLVFQSFFSSESSDDRFRRGREVFAGLLGVLGTIVGFYFGATTDSSSTPTSPTIAGIQVKATSEKSLQQSSTQPEDGGAGASKDKPSEQPSPSPSGDQGAGKSN